MLKHVSDDRLLRREFYNSNDFDVTFTRVMSHDPYIVQNGITLGPIRIHCRPGEWVILNHAFYSPSWDVEKYGKHGICHFNLGADIGRGIKPQREDGGKVRLQ